MDSKLTAQPNVYNNVYQSDYQSDYQNNHDDEIDLFELWNGLVQEKWTIFLSFVVVVLLAAVYAFTATPVYQADSYLLPPPVEKVLPINEFATVLGTKRQDPEALFTQFQKNLESRMTLKLIFDKYNLIKIYNSDLDQLSGVDKIQAEKTAFTDFIKDFSIKIPKGNVVSKQITVSLALPLSEQEVADLLNNVVKTAEERTIDEIYQELVAERQSKINILKNRKFGIRQVAQDKRMDRIAQLDEAIRISQQLGIDKPVKERDFNATLYLMGADFLIAEKAALESRKNDDAFIPGLRELQEDLHELKRLKIVKSGFGVMTLDQAAIYGDKIKPNKALILAVAGVLGLMLGVFIALIRRAVKNRAQADLTTE